MVNSTTSGKMSSYALWFLEHTGRARNERQAGEKENSLNCYSQAVKLACGQDALVEEEADRERGGEEGRIGTFALKPSVVGKPSCMMNRNTATVKASILAHLSLPPVSLD